MSRYYDYFEEQRHTNGEVTIDEFIAEAMRTDLKFETLAEELQYQRTSRITLMNELLTCYQYLKEHDMLLLYECPSGMLPAMIRIFCGMMQFLWWTP